MSHAAHSRIERRWILHYGVAVGAALLAVFLSALVGALRDYAPYALPLAAVALSSRVGGSRPAFLTTVISVLGIHYFLLPPSGSLGFAPAAFFPQLIFVVTSVLIIYLYDARRAAGRAARLQQDWLEVTLSSIGDAVIGTDIRGRIAFLNPIAESLTGWSGADAIGRPLDEVFRIVDEETRQPVESPSARLIREGTAAQLAEHIILLARDGIERPIDHSGAAIRDREGYVTGAVLIFRDVAERRRTEREIRENEERLRLAQDAGRMGTWDWNVVTGELKWSGNLEAIHGLADGRFGGSFDDFVRLIHPEDRQLTHDLVRRALSEKKHLDIEFRVIWPDGSIHWIAGKGQGFYDSAGNPLRMIGVGTDITGRKRAEADLRASEERFATAFNSSPLPKWISTKSSGTLVNVNDAFLLSTGYSKEEVIGRTAAEINLWMDVEDEGRLSRVVQEQGRMRDLELRFRKKSGEERTFLLSVESITLDGEQCVLSAAVDITGRKQTEEYRARLLSQTEAARAAAEAAGRRSEFLAEASAVLSSSLEYHSTLSKVAELAVAQFADWCSVDVVEDGAVRRITVCHKDPAKQDLVERILGEFVPNPGFEHGAARVLRTGEPDFVRRVDDDWLASISSDDEHFRLLSDLGPKSYICVPMRARGRILGCVSLATAESGRLYEQEDLNLAQDLAGRAALTVDNVQLYREAQRANRMKDEFLATVSHELRTPLNSMLGWARMLRTGRLDSAHSLRALETIERNAKAQAQIIEDLLDISRIISGKLRLDMRAVDVVAVIEAAVDSVRLAAEAKGIRIQRALDTGAGPILGDPDRLQQVIWNLLSNAIKFTHKGGRIQVRLERINSHVEITVSDTGVGIEPEFLPRVFERFQQGDSSSTRKHGGLGLGLAIVSQLVELHGGTVEVESQGRNQGSTFRVALPLPVIHRDDGAIEQVHPAAGRAAPFDTNQVLEGLRVLVVEDEPDAREMLLFILGQCGADVFAVGSASEAIKALEEGEPVDVLVSDIEMPGEDGYSLLRKVRMLEADRGGKIPAAALTAYARAEDRMRALSAGFQIHVPKPVEPAELVAVVASLAGRTGKMRAHP
jgi:PAS domain S-box-containing protein